MKAYTVLLLYPDYTTNTFGQETYQAHVKATSALAAIRKARAWMMRDNPDTIEDHDDLFVLAVYRGHLEDLNPRN
jgi:hypothetical protein